METYEMKQERRELMDRLCKEWNESYSSSKRHYSYEEYTPLSERTKRNERPADDNSGGYTLFGIKY